MTKPNTGPRRQRGTSSGRISRSGAHTTRPNSKRGKNQGTPPRTTPEHNPNYIRVNAVPGHSGGFLTPSQNWLPDPPRRQKGTEGNPRGRRLVVPRGSNPGASRKPSNYRKR